MQPFYAHSLEHDPQQENWQKLEDHLQQVSALAENFASVFGSASHGLLAGIWHDLGKYQNEFQQRLTGQHIAIEHSGLGAALAYSKSKTGGLPFAFVIAGHHTGLANLMKSETGLPSPLVVRIKNNLRALEMALPSIPETTVAHVLPELPQFLQIPPKASRIEQHAQCRSIEFWIRFLFSSLIDADRLDTEAFLSPHSTTLRGTFATISQLGQHLDTFIKGKIDALPDSIQQTHVNKARSEILSHCLESADNHPGIFSLTVPTGGGKTLSAMSFALRHAEKHALRRVIVVIPYTSIIEQNAEVYRDALGTENVIEHHSNLDPLDERHSQNPETTHKHNLAAENWDAPIVVTTTVQFFESLFSNRTSRCRKLHNIANSVIILDEVQTLPPGFLNSILDALNELADNYDCTIILSTATPPALAARDRFPHGLKNVRSIVPNPSALAETLKRVDYTWPKLEEPPVEWENLAEDLAHTPRVLAVVHRRQDARTLAQLLKNRQPDSAVFHLSALMCPAHRSQKLTEIRQTLAREADCRVISTQLVEAGVDLDFPIVYRALAGLDSIVQAAGRCNREGKQARGHVVVFQAPTSPPPGTLRKAQETTQTLIRELGALEPEDPDLFERYFKMLYFAQDLDASHIQVNRQEFNFAAVGRDFKLIEDGYTIPIIVPFGSSPERLETLRYQGPNRQTIRALQPFTVSIYPKAFEQLRQIGALEEIAEGLYALIPAFSNMYSPEFGLLLDEDSQKPDPANLIV